MKLSARFEKLIAERRVQEVDKTQADSDILSELIAKYNQFKANSALKRWQITPDQHSAILGMIVGMTYEARELVRAHLDFNKYKESGSSALFVCFCLFVCLFVCLFICLSLFSLF